MLYAKHSICHSYVPITRTVNTMKKFAPRYTIVLHALVLSFVLPCSAWSDATRAQSVSASQTIVRNTSSTNEAASEAGSGGSSHTTVAASETAIVQEEALIVDDFDDYGTFDEYDDFDDYSAYQPVHIADPLEPWNRMWFHVNDFVLLNIGKPVYKGYKFVTPDVFRKGVDNFFHNLLFPVRFVNALLQGEFLAAGVEFDRFFVNTTIGLGGFIDVAKRNKPVVDRNIGGFGQTLGRWGVGNGFYIVWPLLGPSTLRDSVGRVGDYFASPTWAFLPTDEAFILSSYRYLNDLGPVLNGYESLTRTSLEPYTAVRDAYIQMRNKEIAE